MADRITATGVRRDAIGRLISLAGTEQYDPDRMRGDSLEILRRRALRRADGDPNVHAQIEVLWPVARGDAGALYDAVQVGGVGALLGEGAAPAPSIDQWKAALAAWEDVA